jgi:hypothetical protein
MSQLTLTNEERWERLMRFGYAHREAVFLTKAALQGGFFLRRQYGQFTGSQAGGADTALVQKFLANRHGTAIAGCSRTVVYHISARPFYAALGQEDNRNRRMRPPMSIKNRLMGFDYVLDHPGHTYLLTEQEKISFFTRTLGLDLAELPQKPFRSPRGDSTSRFFMDKYPIFKREPSELSPEVSFCFIDEGLATVSRFESYLAEYGALLRRLPSFELIYVSATRVLFWEAERTFQNFVPGRPVDSRMHADALELEPLLDYFERRRLYESGRLEAFDRSSLIRLRNERQKFIQPFFESLYQRWQADGKGAVENVLAAAKPTVKPLRGSFSTYLLRHNYDLFGRSSKPVEG